MKIVAALPNVQLRDRNGNVVPDKNIPMEGIGVKPKMLPKTNTV